MRTSCGRASTAPRLPVVGALVSLLVAGAASACSSGHTSSAASSSPVPPASAPASPSAAPTTGTPSASPTAAASAGSPTAPGSGRATPSLSPPTTTAGCSSARLALTQTGAQGAAGSQIRTYALRNTGTSTCSLYGFPGASFLTGDGRQIGQAASRQGAVGATVRLAPGASAAFQVQLAYAGCPSGTPRGVSLRVYPPGDRGSLLVPWGLPVCQRPTVTAVRAG